VTVEHNTLGPGAAGHVLRNRAINPATYAATDRWFAYDQVGSVSVEMASNTLVATRRWADAWGNAHDWSTGLWSASEPGTGWGHNTKQREGARGFNHAKTRRREERTSA